MKKNKKFWNKLKEDIKQNKRSYVTWGIIGGLSYLILIGIALLSAIGRHYVRFNIHELGDFPFIASYTFFGDIEELFSYLIPDFLSIILFVIILPFLVGFLVSLFFKFAIKNIQTKIGFITKNLIKIIPISILSYALFLLIATFLSIDKLSSINNIAKYFRIFLFYEVDLVLIVILFTIFFINKKGYKRK